MKLYLVILLSVITSSAFAQKHSVGPEDIRAMNLLLKARETEPEVQKFVERATLESLEVEESEQQSVVEAKGSMLTEGDIICGDVKLKIIITHHAEGDAWWNSYQTFVDLSGMDSYCEY